MNQFLSMHYRLGFRQGWILPRMDQIGKIWCGSLEKITMVAVSSSWGAHPGACRSCRAFTRSASSEEACRPAANAHARHAATGGVSHRVPRASPERLHRLSDSRFDVRTCFFSLCVEGRCSKPSATALLSRAIAERLGKRLSRDLPHCPCCCVAAALPASPALSCG